MHDECPGGRGQQPGGGVGHAESSGIVTAFPGAARARRRPAVRRVAAPGRPGAARGRNLPLQLTSFVGREQALAELTHLLATTRLLTLTGAPGVGKTRLALQLAGELVDIYADGVWLLELAPLDDPALVPQAVAVVLGVQEQPGRPLLATLADTLHARQMLLVLDNCEHLVAACAALADSLLRAVPKVTILATSREPLGITGEALWSVSPLALPEPPRAGDASALQALQRSEAVELFAKRARAVQPAFAVTDRNAAAVAHVCRTLEGLPLALELAAARVRALSVEQLARRLDDQLALLTGGSRTALPRQQTLRTAVDWSYALLPEPERILLRRLSVFAGGWTLAMAEGICAGDGLEASEVCTLLMDLVDKSLVVAEPEGDDARYRLLETLRQYGGERLREAGEEAAVRTRHLEWLAAFADGVEFRLRGAEQARTLARLEQEHDNVRAALTWGLTEPGAAAAGLQLAGRMWPFWYMGNNFTEWRRWLNGALALPGLEEAPARAPALYGAGALALAFGDWETAEALLTECLARSRALGDRWHAAGALLGLGRLELQRGNYDRAVVQTEECLALFREAGEKFAIAMALGGLGLVAQARGDHARAAAVYEEGLALFQEQGDKHGIAWSLHYLGLVAQAQGDHERAGPLFRQALALRREFGDAAGIAGSLEGLATAAWAQDQPARAVRLFAAAGALRDTIGVPRSPLERADGERTLAAVRERVDAASFAAAVAEGRAMGMEQAIEYALGAAEPVAVPTMLPAEPAAEDPAPLLSRREREVAVLIAQGLTNRQIAERLIVSQATADTHVHHILTKLDFRSRAQVAAWATARGLLTADPG